MTGRATDPGRGQRRTPTAAPSAREAAVFERIEAFRRRRPRLRDQVVTLAHGAGGKASAALLDAVFLPAFAQEDQEGRRPTQTDAALVDLPSGERLAFSTDSYVVKPLRFPGGSAGHLAVHGTINDLAMMGAHPIAISAAFVLEEGMAIDVLREVVADMAEAAVLAGVPVVTGDTKVVDRGAADGMYITTAGVGVVPSGRDLAAARVGVGDVVLVSGTMGDHGTAVMLARGDLALEADISSDTAPLHRLVEDLLAAAPDTRWLRDSTRGGVGTVCNELARDADLTVVLDEQSPAHPARGGRRLRAAGHRPALRGQRGEARRGRAGGPGGCRPGARCARTRSGQLRRASAKSTPSRPGSWSCGPPWAGPASSTCSSATRCQGFAEGC